MICPACDRTLSPMKIGQITVDVCQPGCAGVWFDSFELQKVDAAVESTGKVLLSMTKPPGLEVDLARKRKCPRCDDVIMMRRFFSRKKAVEIDECPGCGGIWLDAGELGKIHEERLPRATANKESKAYIARLVYQYISQIEIHEC